MANPKAVPGFQLDPIVNPLGASPKALAGRRSMHLLDAMVGIPEMAPQRPGATPKATGSSKVASQRLASAGSSPTQAAGGEKTRAQAPQLVPTAEATTPVASAAVSGAAVAVGPGVGGPAAVAPTAVQPPLVPAPPAPLKPVTGAIGEQAPTYGRFSAQFHIGLKDLQHLLKLVNPEKYGVVWGTDVKGQRFQVSGTRASDSFGNNLSNAGADRRYGTADDIRPGDSAYVTNSQGVGAERWANSESTFLRLAAPEWGINPASGKEQPGRPRGYTGAITADKNLRLVEPVDQKLANARLVSNALGAQDGPVPTTSGHNVYDMSFGQYFDHGLDFLGRSGLGQSIAAATAPSDPLNLVSGGAVGVVGDRGGMHVLDPISQTLIQVAQFSAGPAGAAGGLYSFRMDAAGKPVLERSAQAILGRKVQEADIVYRNRTEGLIQNNQLYGSSDATAYVLRQSARFDGTGSYVAADGTSYKIGASVNGLKVTGVPGGLVQLADPAAPGGFRLVKSAAMLSSRVLGADGLPALPTYAEVLLNNGVNPALVNAVFAANGSSGAAMSSPEWLALTADPRFVAAGNVRNFNPASASYMSSSGQPLIGDQSVSIGARNNSTDFARLAAIDQNVDGIPDVLRGMPVSMARPYLPQFAALSDAQLQAKLTAQTPILSEDWGAGQLLSHVVGGDWRVNENIGLSTIHTMWAREHNFQVENIRSAANQYGIKGIAEEDLFQAARVIIEGQYQKMIYEEFGPTLAGAIQGEGKHGWAGYNPNVDASVSLEFSVASFRVGHSQIPQELIPGIDMFSGFLNPQLYLGMGNTAIHAGLVQKAHEAIDTLMTNGVRNELVTRNLDLFTANVLRGREVGLPGLNALRHELYNNGPANAANGTDITASFKGNALYKPYTSWEEFGANLRDWVPATDKAGLPMAFKQSDATTWGSSQLLDKFRSVYTNLEDVDVWVGMLAEKPAATTGQMGPLMAAIFWEQLDRLQEGDRYYYIDRLKVGGGVGLWNELDSLRDIIARTSTPELALPNKNIFKVQTSNDITVHGDAFIGKAISAGDQLRTITALWNAPDPWADRLPANLQLSTPVIG
jgi:hypothetical protein